MRLQDYKNKMARDSYSELTRNLNETLRAAMAASTWQKVSTGDIWEGTEGNEVSSMLKQIWVEFSGGDRETVTEIFKN